MLAAFNPDHARLCFLIAIIALVILGVVAIVQKATLQGLAWIAGAVSILGFWYLVPS